MRVCIIKSHVHGGRVLEAGKEYDLPDFEAKLKVQQGKATAVSAPPVAPSKRPPKASAGDAGPGGPELSNTDGAPEHGDPKPGKSGK